MAALRQCLFILVCLLALRPAGADLRGAAPHTAISLEGIDIAAAIGKEQGVAPAGARVTGIGVPHHLLAADLMARGFLATRGNSYDRIVVLSPDHFFRSTRPAATTLRSFDTAFGQVATDEAAAKTLLEDNTGFAQSDLFDAEHGVTGLVPFIRRILPDVPVVAVALGIGSQRGEWDRVTETLKKIVTPRTLVVQSTDYSHYLLPYAARLRDQQTLNVLSSGDLGAMERLHQPAHLDSRAANYIQLRLQTEVFGAAPVVIANRTAFDYVPANEPTTSYIVTVYGPDQAALARFRHADQQVYYFGGDTFVGRHVTPLAADEAVRREWAARIAAVTQGAPLILNLEGAIASELPHGLPPQRHPMLAQLALPVLKSFNTAAVSLANNHSHDLGGVGISETVAALRRGGITPLLHVKPVEIGRFRLVAINYIGAGDHKGYPAARPPASGKPSDIETLCRQPGRLPLIAFLHWGEEYRDTPTDTEVSIARDLYRCGVAAIIGAHSHKASPRALLMAGGEQVAVYSVGNFLFDQFSSTSSGALVELRVFEHGTFVLRMIPIPNLYEAGLAARVSVQ